MAVMKETTRKILKFLQEHHGEDLTAADVGEALGLEKRSVDGSFTSFQKKGLGVREEAEITLEDNTHKKVKYLRLTEQGLIFNPDAPTE